MTRIYSQEEIGQAGVAFSERVANERSLAGESLDATREETIFASAVRLQCEFNDLVEATDAFNKFSSRRTKFRKTKGTNAN